MTIAAIICLALTVLLLLVAFRAFRHEASTIIGIISTIAAFVMLVLTIWTGWLSVAPEYRLHKATVEKRILVEQARAEADSAVELARGEIERAKGTAEANAIVADSITEPYLRYLYINNLAKTDNQVIYLPTEAGLPILEATRAK